MRNTLHIAIVAILFITVDNAIAFAFSPSPSIIKSKSLSTTFTSTTPLHSASISISTATGEADRAFRLGIQLEKAGLARAASAAFHESGEYKLSD